MNGRGWEGDLHSGQGNMHYPVYWLCGEQMQVRPLRKPKTRSLRCLVRHGASTAFLQLAFPPPLMPLVSGVQSSPCSNCLLRQLEVPSHPRASTYTASETIRNHVKLGIGPDPTSSSVARCTCPVRILRKLATGQPTTGCFADGAYEVRKLCDHDLIYTMTVLYQWSNSSGPFEQTSSRKKRVYGTVVYVMSLLYHQGLYSTLSVVQPIVP